MESKLHQLYHGEICPQSRFHTTMEQLKDNRSAAFEAYTAFSQKLPEALREEFIQLIDTHLDLIPLELEQSFIEGFRLGARIITEVYQIPRDEPGSCPMS